MLRKSWFLVAVAGIGLAASSAFANHNEPPKSSSLKGMMLTSYVPCDAAHPFFGTVGAGNTTVFSAIPLPACKPAVRSDPLCGFDVKGSGKFSASVKGSDVALSLTLAGLQASCNGTTLQLKVDLLGLTTDDCTGDGTPSGTPADCTVVDIADFTVPNVTCTVAAGKCAIKTTVNTALTGLLVAGKRTGIGLGRIMMFDGANKAFESGLFVP